MPIGPYDLKTIFFGNLGKQADKYLDYNIWLHGFPGKQNDLTRLSEKTGDKNIVPIQIFG